MNGSSAAMPAAAVAGVNAGAGGSSSSSSSILANTTAAAPPTTGQPPTVYLATYSSVPVYELTVRGIACMRRRADGYLNATQILKIAGIEKAKRTKILEKEILTGEHEKVQGGYGKYQGTWIPLKRAQELSARYNVAHLLQPLLDFDPATAANVPVAGPRKRPNPNAPSASMYYRTGPGAAQLAAAKGAVGTSPHATPASASPQPSSGPGSASASATGPSHLQPRFLTLRPPSDLDAPSPFPNIFPPGSTAEQRDTLSGYASYGYTPQGMAAAAAVRNATTEVESSSRAPATTTTTTTNNNKRGLDQVDQTEDEELELEQRRVDKRQRAEQAAATGPSPVKDLNALGRSTSPTSALRGVRPPTKLHRVSLGPPDHLRSLQLAGTRFADRPQVMREGDEGEKRMHKRLQALFVHVHHQAVAHDDNAAAATDAAAATVDIDATITPAHQRTLDELLLELRHDASLAGHHALSGASAAGNGPTAAPLANGATVDMAGPAPCIDLVIDDHGHSALHWASALANLALVKTLVARPPSSGGASPFAGNHAGETPLQRSVLVINSYDKSTFPVLLQLLAQSLHTRDYRRRTILHHIALVSALQGRGKAARYYLACVLEYISRHEGARFASLVDAQDLDGETALGIVARVGNASMVKMLLDVGARKDIANNLRIKPSDWGIEALDDDDAATAVAATAAAAADKRDRTNSSANEVVTSLTQPPRAPVQKSKDVLEQMTTVLSDLADVFQKEQKDKDEAFETAQKHLQSATRELATRRRRINVGQAQVVERDEAKMRRENLSRCLRAEMGYETVDEASGQQQQQQQTQEDETTQALVAQCLAFETESQSKEKKKASGQDRAAGDMSVDEDSLAPAERFKEEMPFEEGSQDALVKLRWLKRWYESSVEELQRRIRDLEGASATKLKQCRKVVAMCCNVSEDKVEGMLDELVTAIESIGMEGVDLPRLAGFLSKVGRGVGGAGGGEATPSSTQRQTLPTSPPATAPSAKAAVA